MKHEEIVLDIQLFTPQTLPMARLAQYLTQFSELLGYKPNIHFLRLSKGSSKCKAYAEKQVVPRVRARLEAVIDGSAPKQAIDAHKAIDELLAADNTYGGISIGEKKLIEFPGRRRAVVERIGPVRRNGFIDGQIFSIGGKDETINVHLRNKDQVYRCEVSIELARRLAPYFLSCPVRLFGSGNWYRVASRWEMQSFEANDFVQLDSKTLHETVADIRRIFESTNA